VNISGQQKSKSISIAVFTAAPWRSAVVVLRITGPAEKAGMRVIQGNQGPQVSFDGIAEADLIVIQRDFPRFWGDYKMVIALAREAGKPVVYDLDDLLVDIPDEHSHKGDYAGEMLVMLHAIIDADLVTASSPNLQAYLSELNPNSKLIHNYLDDSLWELKTPKPVSSLDSRVTIGYMGGQTHQMDLEYIKHSLLNLSNKYPDKVNFIFWGTPPPEELLKLASIKWEPVNFEDYAQFASYFPQQECDIFIAPLVNNEFNNSKSSIKFLEYSSLGISGVYSNLAPYKTIIEHGKNGFLADEPGDWEIYLSALIDDPELRHQLGKAAQRTVNDGWLLSENYSKLREIYQLALEGRGITAIDEKDSTPLMGILSHAEEYQSGLEDRLFAVNNQLNEIHSSRSWKLLKQLQKLRLKIIPKG